MKTDHFPGAVLEVLEHALNYASIQHPAVHRLEIFLGCQVDHQRPGLGRQAGIQIPGNRIAPIIVQILALGCLRSEEHTSELQSLMRISYAVFCLKKKTSNNTRL